MEQEMPVPLSESLSLAIKINCDIGETPNEFITTAIENELFRRNCDSESPEQLRASLANAHRALLSVIDSALSIHQLSERLGRTAMEEAERIQTSPVNK